MMINTLGIQENERGSSRDNPRSNSRDDVRKESQMRSTMGNIGMQPKNFDEDIVEEDLKDYYGTKGLKPR